MSSREDYENLLTAVGLCFSCRIPVLLWGDPGVGKTAVVESAREVGWHVETLVVSHYEPADFAGLPVVRSDGTVDFAPPAWATRLAAHDGPSIAFLDELSTAAPSVQAAALRPLTHYTIGALQLPDTVSWGAAANPADVAAAGWELAPPTASRFVHLDWKMPVEVYTECLVTGGWPTIPLHHRGAAYAPQLAASRALVAAYLRVRQGQMSAMPKDAAGRSRAFPTPRTWDYLSRLLAMASCAGAGAEVQRLLAYGAVGASSAHEFLVWVDAQDLPDPETLLADPTPVAFTGVRPDRVHAMLQAVLAAVVAVPTPERWSAAVRVCAAAGEAGRMDPAVPVVRALVRDTVRPAGAAVPSEIKVFAAPLALAGLLPETRR
jgi:hypothetical protein